MSEYPKTVEEAVQSILGGMSDADKETVCQTKEDDLIQYHHGWGTGIRNAMGLWKEGSELLEDTGGEYPDDASMVIIHAVWTALREKK